MSLNETLRCKLGHKYKYFLLIFIWYNWLFHSVCFVSFAFFICKLIDFILLLCLCATFLIKSRVQYSFNKPADGVPFDITAELLTAHRFQWHKCVVGFGVKSEARGVTVVLTVLGSA